ncbi:MAG: hypothetical protein ABJH68_11910 [Ilumatobacter sp.]|uniref:hypothetical protein n=1 Tax=Ilumatobacter sp. TaxID=1967498 RepID=UPI00329A2656
MSGSAVTPPKGRATRARNDIGRRRTFINPKLQWALVILVALLVFAAIFYFGRDVKSDLSTAGVPGPSTGTAGVVWAHGI